MFGYIYLTTNLVNNMQYIGQKKSTKFLNEKYLGSGTYLKAAVNKYGKENFKVELLATAETAEELNEKEIYYIDKYNAVNSEMFYNMSPGGDVFNGGHILHHTEETKQKISKAASGENNGFYGKHHSEETRAKLRAAWEIRRQIPVSEETRKKLSAARKGKKFTKEHRAKLRESSRKAATGKPCSDSAKQKLSEHFTGSIFINNGIINKRIRPDDFNTYVELGFVRGKLKKSSETIEKITNEKNASE